MSHLVFLFCCFVWGSSFILMDRAAQAFGPLAIGMGRMAGGAAVLALYCAIAGRWVRPSRTDLGRLVLVALLANVWPYVVQPYVMQRAGEHAFFGMLVAFVPLATMGVSAPMLGVWPTPRQLIGVLGGLACMALVVHDGTHRGMSPGLLALAVSTPLSYAVGNTYIKWKLDHLPAAPLTATFLAIGAAALMPLQFSPALLARMDLAGPAAPHDWPLAAASLLALGVVSTGVCIVLFVSMIKKHGPLYAGMVTYVIPVVALAWGQFDRERLSATQAAAIVGVLAMVALVQWNPGARAAAALSPASEPPA